MNQGGSKKASLSKLSGEISEYLRRGELALYCGAGISKNSGLPLANDLKRNILETLLTSKKEAKQVMKAPCPFEAFVQHLFHPFFLSDKNLQVLKILDVFQAGDPNSNHVLIARLAKCGYLKTIATTNFDVLIEKALSKEGCAQRIIFEKYCKEEDFSSIDFAKLDNKLSFFKLHGSIDDLPSVRATIAAVAGRSLSEKRMNVIRHLFSSGEHKAVLVLGYSCSDVFDIIPQILSIQDSAIQVFFVKHSHDPNVLSIKTISDEIRNNPFRHFCGKWIVCNTDLLIKTLWDELADSIGNYELIRGVFDWSSEASSWLGKTKENNCVKSFVTGWILQEMQSNAPLYSKGRDIQLSDKARSYYARALNLAEAANQTRMIMVCNLEMGRISLYKRAKTEKAKLVNYKTAIDYFCEAIRVAARQSTHDEDFIATCYHAIGVTHTSLRAADAARHYLKKSRNHYRRLTDKRMQDERLSGSCAEEGVIYEEIERDYKKALECYKRADNLVNSSGERSEPGLCITFANVYLKLEEYPKAIRCYKKAEEMSDQKGDIYTLNIAHKCLSDAYRAVGDRERSAYYSQILAESEAKLRGFQ